MTFFVVTDRHCGAEEECNRLAIAHRRIEFTDRDDFDARAYRWLREESGVDWVALFHLRLIGPLLYERLPCFNFHPALLPAFPGLNALSRAMESGAKVFGATVHLVDSTVDGGPIVVQVKAPLPAGARHEDLARISFAQKVYLFLRLIEIMRASTQWKGGAAANPLLDNEVLARAFADFVAAENIPWTP